MQPVPLTAPLALLGLEEITGKRPESRLQNGHDARRLLWTTLREDHERSKERAIVKGLIDGNPPYNDAARHREGRAWECNLNFMEGTAIMDASAVPYYALFAGVEYYADCRTAYQPENPGFENWHNSITNRFSNLLKRWPQFNWSVQQISYWMRLHGIGPAYFDRDGDWRFRSTDTSSLLLPRGAASCIDNRLPFIIIRVPYRIVELWDRIKDEESAANAGWDVQAVKNAIMHGMKGVAPAGSNWWAQPWEYYQQILKNNDLTASFTDSDIIFTAHLLVQEFTKPGGDTKISKFIVTENQVVANENPKKDDDKQFLFADPNCYDNFQQAVIAFFQNTGDGTYHSVRGIAMKAFKHLEVSNRLKCQTVNRAFLDSSLVLESQTQRDHDKMDLAVWGTVVRLPVGAMFKATTVQGGTDGVMAVDRMLTNHLANNIGMFNQRTLSREDGRGEMPTATQITQQVAKESTLSQGQITLFYQYLDALYSEMFRRAADPKYTGDDEEAKRFRAECEEDGVPKEALLDMEYIRANRQSGYGSPQMGLLKQQQMLQLVPMLPEEGKLNWLKSAVTLIEGPEKLKFLVPDQHIPNQDDSIAALENGLVQEGRSPVIASGQDDVAHLMSHLGDATNTLEPVNEAIQQGQNDPQALQEAFKYVQIMIPHCEAHLARMQNDTTRGREYKLFQDQLMQLVAFSGKLRGALREAMRAVQVQRDQQAAASSIDALTAAKINAVQSGAQQAALKTQSQIQNQTVKTLANVRQKALSHAVDTQLNIAKTAAAVANKSNGQDAGVNVLDSKLGPTPK